jgi:tRNA isopentenyl-2-thiomethyl-A-37 hydroxylase MiaE
MTNIMIRDERMTKMNAFFIVTLRKFYLLLLRKTYKHFFLYVVFILNVFLISNNKKCQ